MLRRSKKQQQPEVIRPKYPIDYPSGLAVRIETGEVFFIKSGTALKFYSERVFSSWGLTPVEGSVVSLSDHVLGPTLGFRDGTLIHNYADGKVYLISASKRRLIGSPEAMDKIGLDWTRLVYASNAETNLHKEGEPIE